MKGGGGPATLTLAYYRLQAALRATRHCDIARREELDPMRLERLETTSDLRQDLDGAGKSDRANGMTRTESNLVHGAPDRSAETLAHGAKSIETAPGRVVVIELHDVVCESSKTLQAQSPRVQPVSRSPRPPHTPAGPNGEYALLARRCATRHAWSSPADNVSSVESAKPYVQFNHDTFEGVAGFEAGLERLHKEGQRVILSTPDFGKRGSPPECERWIRAWLESKNVKVGSGAGDVESDALVERMLVLPRVGLPSLSEAWSGGGSAAAFEAAYLSYIRALAVSAFFNRAEWWGRLASRLGIQHPARWSIFPGIES